MPRPLAVRPIAICLSSKAECLGSGATRGVPLKTISICSSDTPCFWHFWRLPVSQSNPAITRVICVHPVICTHKWQHKTQRLQEDCLPPSDLKYAIPSGESHAAGQLAR